MRCFEPAELSLWAQTSIERHPLSPCTDCTLEYHREQMALGLCEGRPGMGRPLKPAIDARTARLRAQGRERRARWLAKRASAASEGGVPYGLSASPIGPRGTGPGTQRSGPPAA